jgi:AcrR family transcriptional regulator
VTTTTARRTRNRKGQGARLREEILEAASAQLAEVGDGDALTIRGVAAACGVTPPAVYQHFPDKAALLREVLEREFAGFEQRLHAAEASATDPCVALRRRCQEYLRFGAEQPGSYRVLFSARQLGPRGLELQPEQAHPGAAVLDDLLRAVERCLVGRGRSTDETYVVALQLWTALHGMVDLRNSKPEMDWPPANEMVDALLEQLRLADA